MIDICNCDCTDDDCEFCFHVGEICIVCPNCGCECDNPIEVEG